MLNFRIECVFKHQTFRLRINHRSTILEKQNYRYLKQDTSSRSSPINDGGVFKIKSNTYHILCWYNHNDKIFLGLYCLSFNHVKNVEKIKISLCNLYRNNRNLPKLSRNLQSVIIITIIITFIAYFNNNFKKINNGWETLCSSGRILAIIFNLVK